MGISGEEEDVLGESSEFNKKDTIEGLEAETASQSDEGYMFGISDMEWMKESEGRLRVNEGNYRNTKRSPKCCILHSDYHREYFTTINYFPLIKC